MSESSGFWTDWVGVDWATSERDVQVIQIWHPTERGKYITVGAYIDGVFYKAEELPEDTPGLMQPQDNSPMLSKNHKRK